MSGEILKRIAASAPAALFLGYDGTLTRIRPHPNLAVLPPARRRILENLSRHLFIAVISGRSLADIRTQIGIPELACAGSHGLEIFYQGSDWRHPDCVEAMDTLPSLVKEIKSRLRSLPGIFIEGKACTVAVHFRLTPPGFHEKIVRTIQEVTSSLQGRMLVTRGEMLLEIRPAFPWDKGSAVRKIAEMAGVWGRHPLIYIGDDSTDEDAFAALSEEDISICVGEKLDSRAHLHLGTFAEVWKLIKELAERTSLWTGGKPRRVSSRILITC